MNSADQRARYATVTAVARVFALIVLAPPVAFSGDYSALLNVVLIAGVWMGSTVADGMPRVPVMTSLVVEASLISFLVGLSLLESTVLVPALVIPLFVAGLVRGYRGALEVLGAEVVVLTATAVPLPDLVIDRTFAIMMFTWLMVGLGFALIGAVVHSARTEESNTAATYRDARVLITRLLDLSGELVEGLDPVSIGQNIIDLTREELPLTGAMVHTRSVHGVTPLLALAEEDPSRTALIEKAMRSSAPATSERWVAFPLMTDAATVAVVSGVIPQAARAGLGNLDAVLSEVSKDLRHEALQLDTALLFSRVRDQATAEERRRLARDLHDGVAQDLASLGYLIDDLTATATSDAQADHCRHLRGELSNVVAELRRSIFSLRNETTGASSLGESIRVMAEHIEARAGIAVEVHLDESVKRLRPDVEAELLRIAQEGMNNAVKHSRANRISVWCTVRAPVAELRVRDDGRGLQPAREDSHGIRIMRERARRIGASFQLGKVELGSGTEVRVVLEAAARPDATRTKVGGMAS